MSITAHRVTNVLLILLAVVSLVGIALLSQGCGFYHATTPAGVPCPDIPLIGRGEDVRMYTRRHAIKTPARAGLTASERKEILRQLACDDGADSVVEIQQEAFPLPTGDGSCIVLSGFTARWKGAPIK